MWLGFVRSSVTVHANLSMRDTLVESPEGFV